MAVLQVRGESDSGRSNAVREVAAPRRPGWPCGDMCRRLWARAALTASRAGAVTPLAGAAARAARAQWGQERLRPFFVSLASLYLGGDRLRSHQLSMGPYHADRVFRTWR